MGAALVYPQLSSEELAARWHELIGQPGLPWRFELDQYGEIVEMIAPKTAHQRIVRSVLLQIEAQLAGEALPGIGVLTAIGVRIPDVAWQKAWAGDEALISPAPTLCVEVVSPDNTRREIDEKAAAYLAAGATEVIVVELSGRIRFFGTEGERAASALGLTLTLPPGTYPRP
jgi:Uma2 family endonuclease